MRTEKNSREKSRLKALVFLCVVFSVLSPQSSGLVHGQQFTSTKRRELEKVVQELNEKRSEIEKYRKEERILERDVTVLEDRKDKSREKLRRLKRDLSAAQGRSLELRQEIEALQTAFGGWRELLAADLREYAVRTRLESPYYGGEDLWTRLFLGASVASQARFLANLRGMQASTERAAADSRQKEQVLTRRSEKELQETKRQEVLVREKKGVLEDTQARREKAFGRVRELEEAAQALNQLLRSLARGPQQSRRQALPVERHSLPWPVEGQLVGRFGKEKVRDLDTWVIRQGIRVDVPAGTAVRSVGPGKVVYAGTFRKYGHLVIVDHGDGFFSVYGYLERVSRDKGDEVEAQDLLGYAGASEGDVPEPALPGRAVVYFEVRQNGQALDPLGWLKKR